MSPARTAAARAFARRLRALVRKELRQVLRDRSNLLIGLGLPIVLILIFGYALSLDARDVRLAVALEDGSPEAHALAANLDASPFLSVRPLRSLAAAREALSRHEVDAVVHVPADFARRLAAGDARVMLLLQGSDPTRAAATRGYVEGAVATGLQKAVDRGGRPLGAPGVQVVDRLWFNAANTSTWYLVPGLVVLIMTLTGTFLTALVMAREWERGTLEALFVTPVRPAEILLAKIVAYFAVGMGGFALCLLAARVLFHVPLEGSLAVLLAGSAIYLAVSLGIGLLISALTRNQFLASQVGLVASFMPALMLSGFVFDLRNVPIAVRIAGQLLPATWFMEFCRTVFLAGNYWPLILKDGAILLGSAVLFLGLARVNTRKRLD